MGKIIIDYDDSMDYADAVIRVLKVMREGKISHKTIRKEIVEHYCWHTKFIDDVHVSVRPKRTKDSADSFVVYKSEN